MLPIVAEREPADDAHLLHMWRLVAIGTDTFLIAFTVVVDTLGRLLVDPTFRVSESLFIALVSAWLVLLGLEGLSLYRGRTNGR